MTDIEDVLSRDFLDRIGGAMKSAIYYESAIRMSAVFLTIRATIQNADDPTDLAEIYRNLRRGKKPKRLAMANDIIKKQLGKIIPNLDADLKTHTNTRNWVVHQLANDVSAIMMIAAIPVLDADKKILPSSTEDINRRLDKMEQAHGFALKVLRTAAHKFNETTAEKIPEGFRGVTFP